MQQRPLEVLAERRLPGDAARLLEPDRRRDDRLVRAALGRERDPGRRPDQDRLRPGVDPERPRLERAVDERVVERADRQQRLAVARPGRPELAEQADEVALGDPELDVLAVLGLAPAHERVGVVGEPVDPLAEMPDADAVDPAAEVGRRRDVRADRHDPRGNLGRRVREVDEEAPEAPAAWRRGRVCSRPSVGGTAGGGHRRDRLAARAARRRARHSSASGDPAGEARPGIGGVGAELGGQAAPTARRVSSAEWLAGWPSVGSRHALIV